jgi:hypothetical protein
MVQENEANHETHKNKQYTGGTVIYNDLNNS